ncbi:MAG TPA: biotin/lipoyl-containing protein, partial [Myxococcaceae bacterium]|nr:biotin/lipoyl-containing protein [Myxococcaceae bacterium]
MAVELTVPALGESITEAVVGKWHKKVGDTVAVDEPLVVLETDKVTIDVPAPAAGTLASIAHGEGDTVKIGDVLGSIAPGAGAAASAPAAKPAQPAAPAPAPAAVAAPRAVPAPAAQAAPSPDAARQVPMTPVARAIADANGLDPSTLRGTGAAGRVM